MTNYSGKVNKLYTVSTASVVLNVEYKPIEWISVYSALAYSKNTVTQKPKRYKTLNESMLE